MQRSPFLIALAGLALAASAVQAAEPSCTLSKYAELPVVMDGLRPTVSGKIEGHDVRLLIDSGAFFNMMSADAAARFGLRFDATPEGLYVSGVGGTEIPKLAVARALTVGPFVLNHVQFLTTVSPIFGSEVVGLIGQNFLDAHDIEYDLANGVIRLFTAGKGCGAASRAYWSKDYSVLDIDPTTPLKSHVVGSVTVNGHKLRAVFDTGAGVSAMTLKAAARVGLTPTGTGVVEAGINGGIGKRQFNTWLARVDSFGVGDETVKNTALRFGDMDLNDSDMLLGPDFFLSHRIYVSKDQHKIYMTYNGGPVFTLGPRAMAVASGAGGAVAPAPSQLAQAVSDEGAAPGDGSGYSRRAAARAARRDFVGAIADLSRAAELEPTVAKHLYDRALARLGAHEGILAMADLVEALRLQPDYPQALMARGALYLSQHDEVRARPDFEAAIRLSPPDSTIRLAVAGAYDRAGLFETAVNHYDRWIADHPKNAQIANVLNSRCWTRGEWNHELDKGLADCDAALKLQPRNSAFLDSRGLVRLRLGQVDQAIADYDAALALQPKQAWTLYVRGLAKQKKGLRAEAEADMSSATVLDKAVEDRAKQLGLTTPG